MWNVVSHGKGRRFLSEGHLTHEPDGEAGNRMVKSRKTAKVASKDSGDGGRPSGQSQSQIFTKRIAPGCSLLSLPLPAFPEQARRTLGSTFHETRVCLADQECLSGQIKLPSFQSGHVCVFLRGKKEQRPEGHCLEIPTQNLNTGLSGHCTSWRRDYGQVKPILAWASQS